MIRPGEQFKIKSIEELEKAYKYLNFKYSLSEEIKDFKRKNEFRWIICNYNNEIYLRNKKVSFKEIPNPFKIQKPYLTDIDKALYVLSDEAKKLGYKVQVVFSNIDK